MSNLLANNCYNSVSWSPDYFDPAIEVVELISSMWKMLKLLGVILVIILPAALVEMMKPYNDK